MSITKTLRASALAASLAIALGAILTPTPAMADTATGNTAFKVILQPVTLLYYYGEVDLTIPQSALLSLAGGAPKALSTQTPSATSSLGTLSATLTSPAGSAPGGISNIALTMANFWAVRSITSPGTGGGTTVSVSFSSSSATASASLTGATSGSTAKIGLSGLATTPTSFAGTGLGGAQLGSVSMDLNLTNAATADTYQGATIYITAISS